MMERSEKKRILSALEKELLEEITDYVKTQKGIDNVKQIVENAEHELEEKWRKGQYKDF